MKKIKINKDLLPEKGSGSNINGSWVKEENGFIRQWGTVNITPVPNTPTTVDVTLPIPLISTNNAAAFCNASSGAIGTQVLGTSIGGLTTTIVSVTINRNNKVVTGVYWEVSGKWK